MRINPNFKLREMAGETIIVNQGHTGADLTRIISLNKSARRLYEQLSDKEFTLEDTAKVLTDTYGIDGQQALKDATVWVEAQHQRRMEAMLPFGCKSRSNGAGMGRCDETPCGTTTASFCKASMGRSRRSI